MKTSIGFESHEYVLLNLIFFTETSLETAENKSIVSIQLNTKTHDNPKFATNVKLRQRAKLYTFFNQYCISKAILHLCV